MTAPPDFQAETRDLLAKLQQEHWDESRESWRSNLNNQQALAVIAAALAAAYEQSPKELVAFIEREIRCVPPSEWATTKLALDRVLMFAKQLAAPVRTAQES